MKPFLRGGYCRKDRPYSHSKRQTSGSKPNRNSQAKTELATCIVLNLRKVEDLNKGQANSGHALLMRFFNRCRFFSTMIFLLRRSVANKTCEPAG
jgi:hypothetical protein